MAYLDNNGVTYLWNKIKGLFNKGITNLSVSGKTITFTKGDGTTGTITTQDTNTTYGNFKGATASADGGSGLVPAPTKGNEGKYLKADGTWGTPANTTYADMKGATSSAAGTHGLVPAPAAGKQSQYLRGDGTWATPTNTTYSDATQSAHGLMSVDVKRNWMVSRVVRTIMFIQLRVVTNTSHQVVQLVSSLNGPRMVLRFGLMTITQPITTLLSPHTVL